MSNTAFIVFRLKFVLWYEIITKIGYKASQQGISSFSCKIVGVLLFFIVPNYVNQCSKSLNIQDEYNKSYVTIILSSVVMKIFRGLITVLECHSHCKTSRSKLPIAFHHRFS